MKLPQQHKRLTELIGLVRDGRLTEVETTELEAILESDPEAISYYVEAIDITSLLHRQQGMIVDDGVPEGHVKESRADDVADFVIPASFRPPANTPQWRGSWSAVFWTVAVCASLAIGVIAGQVLLPTANPQTKPPIASVDFSDDEFATLSLSTGCQWDSTQQPRFEGQRLKAETLRLLNGVAVVHFDCDVRLILEGPAQLELAAIDQAMLRHGQVVFAGDGDLERFTLDTPFSRIQDEGTEYAVSVERSGEVGEIHVFDGRVICEPSTQKPTDSAQRLIPLDAGDARRFSGPGSIEKIELASSRFVRQPRVKSETADSTVALESFAYESESLDQQNGGEGWQQPWAMAKRFEAIPGATLRRNESLNWPTNTNNDSGSLLIDGSTAFVRTLQDPIRMNQDAAYYLSFLIKPHAIAEPKKQRGWAYITLRNPENKVGSISIGPATHHGRVRIMHDGRVANATSSLREDVVYLFACKIQARKNKDDQVFVRIYGDHEIVNAVEPSAWNITARPLKDDNVLSELRLITKNSAPIQLDELRLGTTWSSVTAEYSE